MDWFLITLAVSATALMVWIDRTRFGTWLTPTAILTVPYVGIALLAFMAGPTLGYRPLYTPSLIVWVCYAALFWGTGQLLTGFLPRAAVRTSLRLNQDSDRPLALTLAWLAIPILAYGTWVAGNSGGGFQEFQSASYREAVMYGWGGHILVFSYPIFIYLVAVLRRQNAVLCGVSAALLFVLMVLRPTKSWVLLPLLAGLFCRARMGRLRISPWKVVAVVVLMYCLFNATYLITFGASDPQALRDPEVYSALFRHVGDYFFAGVLAYSGHMQNDRFSVSDPTLAYGAFVNIGAFIAGYPTVSDVNPEYTVIRPGADGFQANVYTMFGTLIMSTGYVATGIYSFVLGLLTYAIFLASRRSPDVWITTLWSFVAAGLAFAWFDLYFGHMPFLEVPADCLVLSAISRMTLHNRDGLGLLPLVPSARKVAG